MDNQNRSFEFAMLLTVPAAVALAVAPRPSFRVFSSGVLSRRPTRLPTAYALATSRWPAIIRDDQGFLAGLLRTRGYPHADALCSLEHGPQYVVGSIALFFLFRSLGLMPHLGIAVATTLSGWMNAYLLWSALKAAATSRLTTVSAATCDSSSSPVWQWGRLSGC